VLVVDSHSNDGSAEIAAAAGARVIQFAYPGGYPKKRQWVLDSQEPHHGWILLLDADEAVPSALWREIAAIVGRPSGPRAFLARKEFHFLGRRLRLGGFSHSAVVLFQRGCARFEQLRFEDASGLDMEVHERLLVEGPLGRLQTPLKHEDFKGLSAYVERHNHYSTWEAQARIALRASAAHAGQVRPRLFGNLQERRRWLKILATRAPFEPTLWFLWHYVLCLGFLEGRRGLIAAQVRSAYVAQVRAKVFEASLGRRSVSGSGPAEAAATDGVDAPPS
jgi:hypothetical protein